MCQRVACAVVLQSKLCLLVSLTILLFINSSTKQW